MAQDSYVEMELSTGREKGWHGWRPYRPCIRTGNQSAGAEDATFGTMVFLQDVFLYLAKTRGWFGTKKAHPIWRVDC